MSSSEEEQQPSTNSGETQNSLPYRGPGLAHNSSSDESVVVESRTSKPRQGPNGRDPLPPY